MLRIHCGYCRQTWDVYNHGEQSMYSQRTCPHCRTKIDGETWVKQILPAFGAMLDANRELIKDHTGYGLPSFTVDYIEDTYFPSDAEDIQAELLNLSNRIDDLYEAVNKIEVMM